MIVLNDIKNAVSLIDNITIQKKVYCYLARKYTINTFQKIGDSIELSNATVQVHFAELNNTKDKKLLSIINRCESVLFNDNSLIIDKLNNPKFILELITLIKKYL